MSRATKLHNRLLKKLPEEVEKLREQYPEASIELWSQDEHRIGLIPIRVPSSHLVSALLTVPAQRTLSL
jgi:hypothetical protein